MDSAHSCCPKINKNRHLTWSDYHGYKPAQPLSQTSPTTHSCIDVCPGSMEELHGLHITTQHGQVHRGVACRGKGRGGKGRGLERRRMKSRHVIMPTTAHPDTYWHVYDLACSLCYLACMCACRNRPWLKVPQSKKTP